MLKVSLFTTLILSLCMAACGDQNGKQEPVKTAVVQAPVYDTLKTGVIIYMKGRNEANLAYSLYLPVGYTASKKIPVVVLLDAHSRTYTSINQYIPTCEKLHIAMVCSGNSRNGLDVNTTNNIVQKTLDDLTARVHTDSVHLYLAGFSGGARVAGAAAAFDSRIKGVIACAAGFSEVANIPYILIAGLKDMNATELFQLHTTLKSPNGFMLFNGIHAWPPDSIMRRGLNAMLTNDIEALNDENKINNIFTKRALDKENVLRSQLQQLFLSSAWDQLLERVNSMKTSNTSDTHADIKALQQRLLAYCGMLCYATVPKAIDIKTALQVYEACDPTNPDVWFFKATYASKTDKAKAKQYLTKAADLGFYDMQRLTQEPILQGIADDATLKKIGENN